jgi:hypothetical protein
MMKCSSFLCFSFLVVFSSFFCLIFYCLSFFTFVLPLLFGWHRFSAAVVKWHDGLKAVVVKWHDGTEEYVQHPGY